MICYNKRILEDEGMSFCEFLNNDIKDTILSDNLNISNTLFCTQYVSQNGEYKIHFNEDISNVDSIVAFCYYSKTKEKVILDVVSWTQDKGELVIDVSNLEKHCVDFTARSYMLCVAYMCDKKVCLAKLQNKEFLENPINPQILKLNNRIFPPIKTFVVNDVNVLLSPMYFSNGYIYIRVREELLAKKDLVSVNYSSLSFKDNFMNIKVRLPKNNYRNFTGFAFTYRYKKSDDRKVYFFEGTVTIKNETSVAYLSGSIDISKLNLKRIIWDLYAVFEENGRKYGAGIVIEDKQIKRILYNKNKVNKQIDCLVKTEKGYDVIFPYYTAIGTIAFMMREKSWVDSGEFRSREFEALEIFNNNRDELLSQKIILIYEKYCSSAQDNGYYFFKYCMDNNVEKLLNCKIFYVIDKKSPDYERVKKYDSNVLDFLSLDHMVYLLGARLLVSSESKSHSYVWRPNGSFFPRFIKKKKLFFLQHGVIALKKIDSVFGKDGSQPVNKFVVSTPQERSIVINRFGYKTSQVCLTGLARWDALDDKSDSCREILLMPTWRSWLDEAENSLFVKSDYYKNYSNLINNDRLIKLLEKYDLVLNFHIHPKFKEYINNFNVTGDRIKIVPYGEKPLNELMMRCKLLITDYSSVCWDVYYMNKPILFYQFDYDLYNTIHGSYINMEKDLFGYRSLTMDKLLDDLENACKSNFKQPKKFDEMRESTFAFTDKNNSSRIVSEIKKMKIFRNNDKV